MSKTGNLEVVYRAIDQVSGYQSNSRTHSKDQIRQIADSIKHFGFTNPILVDEKNCIIAGHGRLEAAKLVGLKDVPTITLTGLSEEQIKALVIADNKLALNAGWDESILAEELLALRDAGYDLDLTGFSEEEVLELLGEAATEEGDDTYTRKVEAPIYEPAEEFPNIAELFDNSKSLALRREINNQEMPDDIREFLLMAADRHTVFNFGRIADYYPKAPREIQALMESSALVIIDFDRAIEEGFVELTERICQQYEEDYSNG